MQLALAVRGVVPQAQDEVGVRLVDLGEDVRGAGADHLGGLLERLRCSS